MHPLHYTTPITPEFIHGALEFEQTALGLLPHRLPARARMQCQDAQLAMAESQPAGVRLALQTAASTLELHVLPTRRAYAGMPPRPPGVYDLVVDGHLPRQVSAAEGALLNIDPASGAGTLAPAPVQVLRFEGLPAAAKTIEIWLPHNETTELVSLHADAPVMPATRARTPRWLHHGSSISQGSNATHPSGTWPAVAARLGSLDLCNLGFGGSALLDPFVARTIRDLPADLVTLKIGINLVNLDAMRMRVFGPAVHGFLDTIRDGHPVTPLVVMSPIFCPIHEQVPGPTRFDMAALAEGRLLFEAGGSADQVRGGKLTLELVRRQLDAIVRQRAQDDPNLHYLDGLQLYGPADAARFPLPDALHPDGATHRLIGERFARLVLPSTFSMACGLRDGPAENP
jgi:hypothetical protein